MPAHLAVGVVALASALVPPAGAPAASCAFDVPTATLQVQMLSARAVIGRAGAEIAVEGRACAPAAATRRIVVASAFPPATDTVVVDERRGRVAAKLYALTGTGGDTIEVVGSAGPDRFVAHDDLGASIDLDGDGNPDLVSTDVGRIVLLGGGGNDRLVASAVSARVDLYGGPGDDVLVGGRSGRDHLSGGPGRDRLLAGDNATGGKR